MNNYLDRIEEECEQYRVDANRAVNDLVALFNHELTNKNLMLPTTEVLNDGIMIKNLQDKFNRIHLYSEDQRKNTIIPSDKLAFTPFTNDTVQSEAEKMEGDDLKILNTQISKLEDIINKISNGTDEKFNAIILKGLERINTKLDNVVIPVTHNNDQQAIDSSKPVI